MSLGTLFVKLGADTSQIIAGANKGAKAVEELGQKFKAVGSEVAQFAAGITAMAAGALALAKDHSQDVGAEMDRLKGSLNRLAVNVSQMLLPAVRALSDFILRLAHAVRSLSPETKDAIATAAKWAVGLGVLAGVLSKVIGVVTALGTALRLMALNPWVLAITAGIAAIVLVVAKLTGKLEDLKKIWDDLTGGGAKDSPLGMAGPGFAAPHPNITYDAFGNREMRTGPAVTGRTADGVPIVGIQSRQRSLLELAPRHVTNPLAGGPNGLMGEAISAAGMFARDFTKGIKKAGATIVEALQQGAGLLGRVISAAANGAANGGGLGGAVAAVFVELLMSSKQFATVVDMVNNILQILADTIGSVLSPFKVVIGGIGYLFQGFAKALGPVFEVIGEAFSVFAPVLVVLGEILGALAPVFRIVAKAFMLIMNPLSLLAGPILRALFEVLKGAGWVILKVVQFLAPFWNKIMDALAFVFDKISGVDIFGFRPFEFMRGWADGLRKSRVDMEDLAKSIADLEGLTWDAAMAKANETAAVLAATDSLNEFAGVLNGPSWYKIDLARWGAADAGMRSGSGPLTPRAYDEPGVVYGNPYATVGGATDPWAGVFSNMDPYERERMLEASESYPVVNIQVKSDIPLLVEQLNEAQANANVRSSGTPVVGAATVAKYRRR